MVRARREADEGVCLPRSVKVNHDRLSLADKVAQLACAAVLGNQVHIDERLPDKSCTPHIPDLAADQRTKSQVQMASLRVNSADSVLLQWLQLAADIVHVLQLAVYHGPAAIVF